MNTKHTYVMTLSRNDYYGKKTTGSIEVTIDLEQIAAELARKAFYNKSRRSRFMRGAIKGVAFDIQEVPR